MNNSIQIILDDGNNGTSKDNVIFEYQKVADIIDGQYFLIQDYNGLDLNELEYSDELDRAANIINKYMIPEGTAVTNKNGEAFISGLEVGVYLLRVSDKAKYENVSPVLITIPTFDEESGQMQYDVTVIPKHSPNDIEGQLRIENYKSVKTGDSSHLASTMGMCIVALLILLFIIKRSRRQKRI